MKEQTEVMLRNAMAMDQEITTDMVESVINCLKGESEDQQIDSVMKREDVMRLLHISRTTIDYYVKKGYLNNIYGGRKYSLGISRESFIRFTRRRTPGK